MAKATHVSAAGGTGRAMGATGRLLPVSSVGTGCKQPAAPGVFVHVIDGVGDHVHWAVSVPTTINISEWIGDLKGESVHFINGEICNRKVLEWQTGYGVVSFGTKDL